MVCDSSFLAGEQIAYGTVCRSLAYVLGVEVQHIAYLLRCVLDEKYRYMLMVGSRIFRTDQSINIVNYLPSRSAS